jgi:enediyne biosynthesis protein CalE5
MAISSWGPPERVPFLALPMRTAMKRLEVTPPPPGTPGPLSRPTPEALAGLLEGGGFSDVEVEEAEVTHEWQSPEDFATFIQDRAADHLDDAPHPQEVQDETWSLITEAIREESGDGAVRLSNLALLATGRT